MIAESLRDRQRAALYASLTTRPPANRTRGDDDGYDAADSHAEAAHRHFITVIETSLLVQNLDFYDATRILAWPVALISLGGLISRRRRISPAERAASS
jgi:hypothetical protein